MLVVYVCTLYFQKPCSKSCLAIGISKARLPSDRNLTPSLFAMGIKCVFTPRSWRQAALKETSVATFALCWLRSCRELDGLDSWSASESVYVKI